MQHYVNGDAGAALRYLTPPPRYWLNLGIAMLF